MMLLYVILTLQSRKEVVYGKEQLQHKISRLSSQKHIRQVSAHKSSGETLPPPLSQTSTHKKASSSTSLPPRPRPTPPSPPVTPPSGNDDGEDDANYKHSIMISPCIPAPIMTDCTAVHGAMQHDMLYCMHITFDTYGQQAKATNITYEVDQEADKGLTLVLLVGSVFYFEDQVGKMDHHMHIEESPISFILIVSSHLFADVHIYTHTCNAGRNV